VKDFAASGQHPRVDYGEHVRSHVNLDKNHFVTETIRVFVSSRMNDEHLAARRPILQYRNQSVLKCQRIPQKRHND
jgi:hypothetical protein